jgi:conserved hypothetical protein TIGR00149
MEVLKINTHSREVMINITEEVKSAIKSSGIKDGICTVYVPHTTAGVTINENADPDVKDDIIKGLDEIIPNIRFKHMEGNSDAHIKSVLVGQFCQFDSREWRNSARNMAGNIFLRI